MYLQNTGGSFTPSSRPTLSGIAASYADADTDGDLDLFLGNGTNVSVEVNLNPRPTNNISNLTATAVSPTAVELSWQNGNGAKTLLAAAQGAAFGALPTDLTDYTASNAFGSGQAVGGGSAIFNGAATTVTLNQLVQGQQYVANGYSYSTSNGRSNGLTAYYNNDLVEGESQLSFFGPECYFGATCSNSICTGRATEPASEFAYQLPAGQPDNYSAFRAGRQLCHTNRTRRFGCSTRRHTSAYRLTLPAEVAPGTEYRLRASYYCTSGVTGTVLAVPFAIQGKPELAGAADSTVVYIENQSPQLLFAGTRLADPDDNVRQLRLTTTGFIAGEDSLRVQLPAGTTLTQTEGDYLISGTATIAQYQLLIDSLGYYNASDSLTAATRTVALSLTDESGFTTDTLSRTVTLRGLNDAPTGTQPEDFVAYTLFEQPANNASTNQTPAGLLLTDLMNFGFADADTAQQQGVLVTAPGAAAPGAAAPGQWQFTTDGGANWQNIDFAQNALRLIADEQAADKQLRLLPTPDANGLFPEAIALRLWDATDLGEAETEGAFELPTNFAESLSDTSAYSASVFTAGVEIEAVNGAPVIALSQQQVQVDEDAGAVNIGGLIAALNDGDPELEQELTATFVASNSTAFAAMAQGPQLNLQTGELTFTPAANAVGTINYQLTVSDNGSNELPNRNTSQVFNFAIEILPINDAPAFAFAADTLRLLQDFEEQQVELNIADIPADELRPVGKLPLAQRRICLYFCRCRAQGTGEAATASLNLSSVPFRYGTFTFVVEANDGAGS